MATQDDPTPPASATDPHLNWPKPKFEYRIISNQRLNTILLSLLLVINIAIGFKVFEISGQLQSQNNSAKVRINKEISVDSTASQTAKHTNKM